LTTKHSAPKQNMQLACQTCLQWRSSSHLTAKKCLMQWNKHCNAAATKSRN